MPVSLSERELRDALALLGEWDPDGAGLGQSALELMGWEGEGPLLLRRYDVQLYLWSTMPRKFMAPLEDKREAAASLGRLLDRLGGRAAEYAAVCRAPETEEMLRVWEDEDPAASSRLIELMVASGLEPPDTELLAWGDVMGIAEVSARREVATEIEWAVEDGRLTFGASDFKRRQAAVTDTVLLAPGEEGEERRLDAIHDERLERWRTRGAAFGSPARSAIIDPVASLITLEVPAIDADKAGTALAPTIWVLEQAGEGIGLTQTGALNRAFVRAVAERCPGWWEAEIHGPPHRETDVTALSELHELLRRMRLLRRRGREVIATKRGRELAQDPPALLRALAVELLAGESFEAACAELAAALILAGAEIDFSDELATQVQPAIGADGWRAGGETPDIRDISWTIAAFLRPAEAIGILERDDRVAGSRRWRVQLRLTEPGRSALLGSLRARALAPARGPY